MALSLFGSAALRLDINAPDSFNAQLNIFTTGAPLVVTIVIVGLLWWMTKISERRSPAPNRVSTWIRIGVATLAMTLVLFLLQVIFAARATALEAKGRSPSSAHCPLVLLLPLPLSSRARRRVAISGTEASVRHSPLSRSTPLVTWIRPPSP